MLASNYYHFLLAIVLSVIRFLASNYYPFLLAIVLSVIRFLASNYYHFLFKRPIHSCTRDIVYCFSSRIWSNLFCFYPIWPMLFCTRGIVYCFSSRIRSNRLCIYPILFYSRIQKRFLLTQLLKQYTISQVQNSIG
jgi:hypothetical protein